MAHLNKARRHFSPVSTTTIWSFIARNTDEKNGLAYAHGHRLNRIGSITTDENYRGGGVSMLQLKETHVLRG